MEAHHEVVFDHPPRDSYHVCCLPGKYILVRMEETDQRLFLVWGEAGAYGEGGAGAPVVDWHMRCLRSRLREQLFLLCRCGFRGLQSIFGAWS